MSRMGQIHCLENRQNREIRCFPPEKTYNRARK